MILNAYAVLDGFVTLLRLGLAFLVLALGLAAWRAWRRRSEDAGKRTALENHCYLLFLLAGLLLALDVVSWPIFYLLLQSYVPEWPGVMCIYGVTQIGVNSVGISHRLPGLIEVVQASKPLLVFLSGAWAVLYLVNRQTRTAPLTGRVLLLVLATGLLALTDGSAEAAYLAIPKKQEVASAGCCTQAFDAPTHSSRVLPAALPDLSRGPWLWTAYYGVNGGMVLALGAYGWLSRRGRPGWWLVPLLAMALVSALVNALFLVDVAAPRLIHLPYHHCPYDLVPRAPESLLAIALYLGGCFAVGWACVADWLGGCLESRPFLAKLVGRLLVLALLGYLGSLILMSTELILA